MNRKTFTLIESLVTALIGTIIMASTVTYFVVSNRINNQIILQSKGQSIMTYASKIIENWVKNGALLDVQSGGDVLIVKDSGGNDVVRFNINNSDLTIQLHGHDPENLVAFEDVSFEGSFAIGTEARAAYIDLQITFIDGQETISTQTSRFIAKCRNHIYN